MEISLTTHCGRRKSKGTLHTYLDKGRHFPPAKIRCHCTDKVRNEDMRCPYCGTDNSRVIESRAGEDGTTIRRRRECTNESCARRFTTYERVEQRPLMVIKKDAKREEFSFEKLYRGVLKACEKRPISVEKVEEVVERIDRSLHLDYEREIPSSVIGERVMEALRQLDGVAYVRFASVYREFRDVATLAQEVLSLLTETPDTGEKGKH